MFNAFCCIDGTIKQLGPFATAEETVTAWATVTCDYTKATGFDTAFYVTDDHPLLPDGKMNVLVMSADHYCTSCEYRGDTEEFLPATLEAATCVCPCCKQETCLTDNDPPEIRLAHMARQRGVTARQLMELLDIDPERMHNPSIEDVLTFSLEDDDPDWVEEQICLHERIGKWKTK